MSDILATTVMRRAAATAFAIATLPCIGTAAAQPAASGLAGARDVVVGKELVTASRVLGREMTIKVYLPDSYHETSRRYPVLYTFQSQFLHVAGTAAYLAATYAAPELVVVSVESYSSSDLSPERLESDPSSGGADRFLRFFNEELFPLIQEQVRVQPFRIVFAGSFGGGFVVYTALSQPETFDAYIAATPAIDFEGQSTLIPANAEKLVRKTARSRRTLYMALEDDPSLAAVLETFVATLRRTEPGGLTWEYHHWPEESHHTVPYRTVFQGLRFIFSRWSDIPQAVTSAGADAIAAYRVETSAWYGCDLGLSRIPLVRAVNERIRASDFAAATRIAVALLEIYPDYDFGHRLLGRAYEGAGRLDLALAAYERALDLATKRHSPHVGVFRAPLDRLRDRISATPPP